MSQLEKSGHFEKRSQKKNKELQLDKKRLGHSEKKRVRFSLGAKVSRKRFLGHQ